MKLYIKQAGPGPRLFLSTPAPRALLLKSTETNGSAPLFLADLSKGDCGCAQKGGNPHRDPSVGQYIAGGGGAAKGKGQKDLSRTAESLMKLPGEELEKKTA